MLQPYRKRTWAPRGQTPVQLVSAKHHRRVSAIGALALSPLRRRVSLYFQLIPQSFKTPQVVEFLRQLHHQLGRKIIIVWDRLNAHRSAARWYAEHHPEWFTFEWLPAYAPELNPIESCWSHTKCNDLANFNAENVDQLHHTVNEYLTAKRKHQALLRSWFAHAGLKL